MPSSTKATAALRYVISRYSFPCAASCLRCALAPAGCRNTRGKRGLGWSPISFCCTSVSLRCVMPCAVCHVPCAPCARCVVWPWASVLRMWMLTLLLGTNDLWHADQQNFTVDPIEADLRCAAHLHFGAQDSTASFKHKRISRETTTVRYLCCAFVIVLTA